MKASTKVVHLHDRHDSFRSPKVVLQQALENSPRIKQVTLIIEWDDGTYAVDHSPATVQQLMVTERIAHKELGRRVADGYSALVVPTARQV